MVSVGLIMSNILVLATPDNGVAAVLYNSCKANVKVGDGTEITLREQTNYPFEEMTRFTVGRPKTYLFPLLSPHPVLV
mgnify:CR=1 FL=1